MLSEVITYYLEMNSRADLRSSASPDGLSVVEAEIKNYRVNRFLYQYVGEPWDWTDKLALPEETWKEYAESPWLSTWMAYYKGAIAGYFELQNTPEGEVEIVYFGLAADFIGKGFGGYLLTRAIEAAWGLPGAKRVWVHTCTLDHPSALKNYQSRGFTIYHQGAEL
jgi:GNAT superfamily N-acetyltransferase